MTKIEDMTDETDTVELDELTPDELLAEIDELNDQLKETEDALEATEAEWEVAKEKIEQLESEREMEGWEEWGKWAASQITGEELDKLAESAKVSSEVLMSMFRKGVTAGIQMMVSHVQKHVDDAWKPYVEKADD